MCQNGINKELTGVSRSTPELSAVNGQMLCSDFQAIAR